MRLRSLPLLLSITLYGVASFAGAQSVTSPSAYWKQGEAGWHFYEPTPLPKKVVPPRPIEPTVSTPAAKGPETLSTAWLNANMTRYREQAIDDPSAENVELYLYMQRLAMDRAERFAQQVVRVSTQNPALDETARSATSAIQKSTANKISHAAKEAALRKISARAGLWYFYSSTCPYCAQQEPILERIQSSYALNVLPISLDGGPLASGSTAPYVLNNGHAQELGVMQTPTLVVADTASGELHNLAAGLRTDQEIEDRLLELGKIENWITNAEYEAAVVGNARSYITDGLVNLGDLKDDSAAMLEALRRASYEGGATPWMIRPTGKDTQ